MNYMFYLLDYFFLLQSCYSLITVTDWSSHFQARSLKKENLKLMSMVKKLKVKMNKHKEFVEIYKNEFNLFGLSLRKKYASMSST